MVNFVVVLILIVIVLIIVGYVGWLFYKGDGIKLPSGLPAMPSLSSLTGSESAGWGESITDAKETGKSKNKLVLVLFTTGDNYSGTSTQFDKDVINQENFMSYAKKRFVLVKLDYSPLKQRAKSPQQLQKDDAEAMLNNVTRFPHVIVFNTRGIKIVDVGYQLGASWSSTPEGFLQEHRFA
jgi:thioredoxin-related protein